MDYIKFEFDSRYVEKKLKELDIKENDKRYKIIKMYFISKEEYKAEKRIEADIETRQKIMESILTRVSKRNK